MAIRTYKVTLDTKNAIAPEPVFLRQGDKTGAVVIDAILMDNGSPVPISGLTPSFMANTADGRAVISDTTGFAIVNASGGEFTYQVPSQLGSVPGKIKIAYFSFTDPSGNQSTFDVAFAVYPAADMTQESAKDWASNLNKIINQYNQWVNDAHNSWEQFVNDNKEIINSIDPGGKVLSELIDFRHSDMLSKTFDTAKLRGDFFDNDLRERGINVKWFGATGDGTTDDTKAFNDCISFASNVGSAVLIPAGNYMITNEIIVPDGIDIIGAGSKAKVSIKPSAISVLFSIGSNSLISGLTIDARGNGKDLKVFSLADDRDSASSCIENMNIIGETSHKIVGISIYASSNGKNAYNNSFLNIRMELIYIGVYLCSSQYGWINGNSFSDVTIIGYVKNAVLLTSDSAVAANVAQNSFNGLQFETISEAETGIYDRSTQIGLSIEYGDRNLFQIKSWCDAKDITPAVKLPDINASTDNSRLRNNIVSGFLESYVLSNPDIDRITDTSHLHILMSNPYLNGTYPQSSFNTNIVKNLISDDLFSDKLLGKTVPFQFSDGVSVDSSIGNHGPCIVLGKDEGEFYIPILGNLRPLVNGMSEVTVGFDFYLAGVDPDKVGVTSELSYFNSTTGVKTFSQSNKRDVAMFSDSNLIRVTATVIPINQNNNDVTALTLKWSGIGSASLVVARAFIVPGIILADRFVAAGCGSNSWHISRDPTGFTPNWQNMNVHLAPGVQSEAGLQFDEALLTKRTISDGSLVLDYPIYF